MATYVSWVEFSTLDGFAGGWDPTMTTYPPFNPTLSSSEGWDDNIVRDRATNGSLRARALWTAAKRAFRLEHVLGAVEAQAMRDFYAARRALTVDFTWPGDGQTYTCMFAAPPEYRPIGGSYWTVSVELEEV